MSSGVLPMRPSQRLLSESEWRPTPSASTLDPQSTLSGALMRRVRRMAGRSNVSWMPAIQGRLQELLLLSNGWDTYGAPPIDRWTAAYASSLLEVLAEEWTLPPNVMPSTNAGVILEWLRPNVVVRITVDPSNELDLYYSDARVGFTWEGPLTEEAPDLSEALYRVSVAR